jgi:type II secretory pathway pseudopilin PulG
MQRPQRGAALLIFLVLLVVGALTYVVNNLTPETIEAARARKTEEALAQARDALIGYALSHRERQAAQDLDSTGDDDAAMYGFLPMPDVGNDRFNIGQQNPACNTEGCAMDFVNGAFPAQNETVIGRLPWRTLGLPPLRDGYGECLWYAVSAGHKSLGINPAIKMNWDTPGQLDEIVVNAGILSAKGIQNHDRPVAMIFSPGAALTGRSPTAATVTECGGNYAVAEYLEGMNLPPLFATTNGASGDTSVQPKPFGIRGKLYAVSTLQANDTGIAITGETLFSAIRKNRYFRSDIREMLKRMAKCWSFNLSSLSPIAIQDYTAPADKIAGRMPAAPASCNGSPDTAYGNDRDPKGYFAHYDEMIFIARPEPASGNFTVNGDSSCKGVVLFSGPRAAGQKRIDANDKKTLANYLDGNNLQSLLNPGSVFSGDSADADAAPQANGADIAVCVPDPSVYSPVPVLSAPLGQDQLVQYNTSTRELTLGKTGVSSDTYPAAALFGCAWYPEIQAGGFRAYFNFSIENSGHGFTFAAVDARRNTVFACGAAAKHLGYSGNNGYTPPIVHPKIGIEVDTSKQTSAYPAGRADPDYEGGHLAIVYWGDETTVNDDNVHGRPAATVPPADPATRPPPGNPAVPSVVTQNGAGVARLDSGDVSNLIGKTIHVRVEVSPIYSDAVLHNTTYLVEAWLQKMPDGSETPITSAMKNTTRPLASLYPGIDTAVFIHMRDQPTVYDIAGASCASDACPAGYGCGADKICYMKAFQSIRPGFTVSQGTLSKDQVIKIRDFVATWLP